MKINQIPLLIILLCLPLGGCFLYPGCPPGSCGGGGGGPLSGPPSIMDIEMDEITILKRVDRIMSELNEIQLQIDNFDNVGLDDTRLELARLNADLIEIIGNYQKNYPTANILYKLDNIQEDMHNIKKEIENSNFNESLHNKLTELRENVTKSEIYTLFTPKDHPFKGVHHRHFIGKYTNS